MDPLRPAAQTSAATYARCLCALIGALILMGCVQRVADWPPAPKTKQEQTMIDSTLRAVRQIDGWTDAACVIERPGPTWHVRAWKIVHPEAVGRKKCVPWAVRNITLDSDAKVLAYEN